MRVYLTGADGLLGTALTKVIQTEPTCRGWRLHGVSLADFDIADRDMVLRSVAEFRPDVVVHAAANAVVDECEADPRRALDVNTGGVRNIVEACRRCASRLVYLSSDYVFDGARPPEGGYRETDLPNPLSVYGITKLAAEHIAGLLPDHLVVRTSWLFGGHDERVDPVLHALRQAQRGERPRVIPDQFSLPTYAGDLARALVFLLGLSPAVRGTVHVANRGMASWHEVIRYALAEVWGDRPELDPEAVPLASWPYRGRRPQNSTLNVDRLTKLGHDMRGWRDGVREFCAALATQVGAA